MSDPATPRKRILIGAECFADAKAAMVIAEHLVRLVSAELGGLLLEDAEFEQIVATPHQRIITAEGTFLAAPTQAQIRRAVAGDARAFRASLERVASGLAINWSFAQRSGALFPLLREAASDWDLLVIGHRGIHRRAGRVVVIQPLSADTPEVRGLIEGLAGALRAEILQVVAAPEHDRGGGGMADPATEDQMLARIGRLNAAVVVVDATAGPLRTEDQLRHLLDAARCPVLVFGAAGIQAT